MPKHINPLFPSIILPLDGLIEQISEIQLGRGVVLRNLDPSELTTLNQMIGERDRRFWGIDPLPPEIVCVESHCQRGVPDEASDQYRHHVEDVRRQGRSIAERATSLLRLVHAGPIGTRLVIVPLAETIPSAYTIAQIGYLPAIVRPNRPLAYQMVGTTLAELKTLFEEFWDIDLGHVPGLRWLNKAYSELNTDDAVAHIVFGLEQLLLGDNDQSNLSFKLALRGAWLLGADGDAREKLFDELRDGYRLRSKIAHGRLTRELNDEELRLSATLEEMLRQLVLRFLRHREQFEETAMKQMTLGFGIEGRSS